MAVLCPQLSFLRVGDLTDLTDSGIIAVAQKCVLQLLGVSEGTSSEPLTDAASMALTTAAPRSLTCLNMASNYELSSTTLTALLQHCTNMTSLDCNFCFVLSDDLAFRFSDCNQLQHLDIGSCNPTGQQLHGLAHCCQQLKYR